MEMFEYVKFCPRRWKTNCSLGSLMRNNDFNCDKQDLD